MIEEQGRVVSVEGRWAVVEPVSQSSGCGHCSSSSSCGTASLARFFKPHQDRYHALNESEARPGDQVIMGLDERALVASSIAMYILPLIGLIAGAVIVSQWFSAAEGWVLLGMGLGMISGFALARLYGRLRRTRLLPKIVRVVSPS